MKLTQVISEREMIDCKTRATYLDIAYRLLGSYKESAAMPPGGWPGPVIYLPEKRPLPEAESKQCSPP